MATWVAEAEANTSSAVERFWKRALKLWTDIHTRPDTDVLRRQRYRVLKFRRKHRSALYQMADALQEIALERLETIHPCALMHCRIRVITIVDESGSRPLSTGVVHLAVSSSAQTGIVGCGGAIDMPRLLKERAEAETMAFCSTLGPILRGTSGNTRPFIKKILVRYDFSDT